LGYAQGIVQNKCVFCHSAMVLTLAMNPCVLWVPEEKKTAKTRSLLAGFIVTAAPHFHHLEMLGITSTNR
jgi:hypothetical protein